MGIVSRWMNNPRNRKKGFRGRDMAKSVAKGDGKAKEALKREMVEEVDTRGAVHIQAVAAEPVLKDDAVHVTSAGEANVIKLIPPHVGDPPEIKPLPAHTGEVKTVPLSNAEPDVVKPKKARKPSAKKSAAKKMEKK
jgi:hypothetical protein